MKFLQPFTLYKMVKNLHPPESGRLLGLQVGKKFIGLAISDLQYKLAEPCGVLEKSPNDPRLMAQELQKLIKDLSLTGFVVGQPLNFKKFEPSATPSFNLVGCLYESEMLKEVHYAVWDDSYTTLLARKMISSITLEPELEERYVPQFAATGVLQDFLDGMIRYEKECKESASQFEMIRNTLNE